MGRSRWQFHRRGRPRILLEINSLQASNIANPPLLHRNSECERKLTGYLEGNLLPEISFFGKIGSFWKDRTFISDDMNDRLCEGFRALAYESLQCRNPRAPRAGLWVNRLWDGSGG